MRFLVLIHEDTTCEAGPPPASLIDAVGAFREDTTNGRWLDDGGLLPPQDALHVRTEAGATSVLDGPFAEAKEVIGGFFVVESLSPEHMERWVTAFVGLHSEQWPELSYRAEVRQIVDPG